MVERIFSENKAVIFDLELTSWPGSNERNWSLPDEHREIIQIGAVKIETEGDMQEINTFQILVRSLINPILSDYIIDLTGHHMDAKYWFNPLIFSYLRETNGFHVSE